MSFIVVTVLLDMLGIGMIIPVLPKLITSLYGEGVSAGSIVFGTFVASYAVRAVVCRTVCRVGERGRVAVVLANHAVGEHHQQTASFDGSYGSPLRLQAMLVRSDYYWLP